MTDCEEVEKKRAELEALRTDVERLQDEAVREQNALENVLLNVVDLGCAPSGLPRVLAVVLRLLAARGALDAAQTPRDRRALALHARTAAALGAAFLAGLHAGVWSNVGDIVRIRESAHIFRPKMDAESAQELCRRWHKAVERAKDWE